MLLWGVTVARLVITERLNGIPTMGTCSDCLYVTFTSRDVRSTSDSLEELQREFDEHYREKHDGQH